MGLEWSFIVSERLGEVSCAFITHLIVKRASRLARSEDKTAARPEAVPLMEVFENCFLQRGFWRERSPVGGALQHALHQLI